MWNGDKIVVMGVTIEPPYQPESIKSREDNKALNHIRKIVSIYNFCIPYIFDSHNNNLIIVHHSRLKNISVI